MKNTKQQFEEAILEEVTQQETIEKCESISDQQSIDFDKWKYENGWEWGLPGRYIKHTIDGLIEQTKEPKELLQLFKQEFYS